MIESKYKAMNENIYVIKDFFNPKEGDNIYSILGSGDASFMFVENGAKVSGIDWDRAQVDLVRERVLFFKNGNYEMFNSIYQCPLGMEEFQDNYMKRNKYFSEFNISSFKQNLKKLKIMEGNFFDSCRDYSKFNKVYLSNSLNHIQINKSKEDFFHDFIQSFNPGTLFYYVDLSFRNDFFSRNLPKDLELKVFDSSVKDIFWKHRIIEKVN
ncbi:hypothetical protein GW932_04150 [archaeon]|nr:hypothetical protein [archaeon]